MHEYLPVISLFSGAGGLDLGVHSFGTRGSVTSKYRLKVKVGIDNDPVALQTFSLNFPNTVTLCKDIRLAPSEDLLESASLSKEEPVLVVGGPPCTPFSKSGFWLEEKRESRDPNASLLDEYVRVVREVRPEAFVLENVQGLTYATHRPQFTRLLSQLSALGYNPRWKVLLAAEFGIPQLRRRVFIVGRRDGKPFEFPATTHSGISERDRRVVDPTKRPFVTVRDSIGDLLPGTPEPGEIVEGEFGELAAEVPPGQNYLWHTERYGGRNVFRWRSRYWTFLLRLDPQRPSSTLQAQPGPWVGPFHWENVENEWGDKRARRLRVSEIRRLMGFPDDFALVGNRVEVQRQLGNAVPAALSLVVIDALMEQLGYVDVPVEKVRQLEAAM